MTDKILKPLPDNHVAAEVFKGVVDWNNKIVCLPTWEEILEIEYVRSRGQINMASRKLETYCWNKALIHAAAWIQRCKKARIFWGHYYNSSVIEKFEDEHGPKDTWITNEIRNGFLAIEYHIEEIELKKKQDDLRGRQAKLKRV